MQTMAESERTFESIAHARVEVPSAVMVRQVGDEAVILNLDSEQYFGLDPVGRRVLEVLTESSNVQNGLDQLLAEYDVDAARLQADILDLLNDLEQHGLVVLKQADTSAERERA